MSLTNLFNICRVAAGEIASFAARNEEKLFVNRGVRYSRENVAAVPSSYVIPMDSPLQVSIPRGVNIFTFVLKGNESQGVLNFSRRRRSRWIIQKRDDHVEGEGGSHRNETR